MAKARISNYNGYPAIFIDGKVYPPMMATFYSHDEKGEVVVKQDYFENFGKAGVKIYFIYADTEWLWPSAFEKLREKAEAILKVVPDAYFMIRVSLHPPVSWVEENPDDCVQFSDGKTVPVQIFSETMVGERANYPRMYSLCSTKWRKDAGEALLETYDRIEKSSFGDRVVGYFLGAGGTSEWYYLSCAAAEERGAHFDVSEAFRRNFEEFLREKYDNDENALKKAWKDESASFENPSLPTAYEKRFVEKIDAEIKFPKGARPWDKACEPPRDKNHIGTFSNLNNSTKVMDFFAAWHTGTAKSVNYFAKLLKERSNREKLVGAFYGSCGCIDYLNGGTSAATLLTLDSGNVDFLAAPGVYQNRQLGGFAGQREPIDSFRLRNTMFIVEDDTRTHNINPNFRDLYETFTVEDTLNIMKRDFGRDLCEDIQAWWFDQLRGGGQFESKEIYDLVAVQQKIAKEAYEKNRIKGNEIAFIYDEESICFSSQNTSFQAIEFMRDYEISLIGASADSYFHNDLANPDMPSYKLYVFCNAYYLTDEERKAITAKLKKDNAVALWLYAPGFANPDKEKIMSVENICELTGIKVGMKDYVISPKFKVNGEEHPLTQGWDKGEIYGYNYRFRQHNANRGDFSNTMLLYPAFYSVDKEAKNLGYFLQETEPTPALTIKEMDGWTSVFCGARVLKSDAIREIAKYAGCHIFCDTDDVIYASRNYITISASHSGEKTIRFPNVCTAVEVYENKTYGKNVKEITFQLLKGETKTFEIKEKMNNVGGL